jgi:hypothetical protein
LRVVCQQGLQACTHHNALTAGVISSRGADADVELLQHFEWALQGPMHAPCLAATTSVLSRSETPAVYVSGALWSCLLLSVSLHRLSGAGYSNNRVSARYCASRAVLCCAVRCCDVPCSAVLCCARHISCVMQAEISCLVLQFVSEDITQFEERGGEWKRSYLAALSASVDTVLPFLVKLLQVGQAVLGGWAGWGGGAKAGGGGGGWGGKETQSPCSTVSFSRDSSYIHSQNCCSFASLLQVGLRGGGQQPFCVVFASATLVLCYKALKATAKRVRWVGWVPPLPPPPPPPSAPHHMQVAAARQTA